MSSESSTTKSFTSLGSFFLIKLKGLSVSTSKREVPTLLTVFLTNV